MATAISGCVIEWERNGRIRYNKKCDKCGYISAGGAVIAAPKGKKRVNAFTCPKCKARQDIVIQG